MLNKKDTYCNTCKKEISNNSKSGMCVQCVKKGKTQLKKTREKISSALKGRKHTEEHIRKTTGRNNGMFGKKGINNPNYGKKHSVESCLKMSKASIGKKASDEAKKNMSLSHMGIKMPTRSKHHCKNISISKMGKKNPMFGKTGTMLGKSVSLETKRKIRLKMIERISQRHFNGYQIIPNWNPIACKKISEYGKENNYNFQTATSGGEFYIKELGYWVDGYDKEKNTVIEFYEKNHNTKVQKDLNRETEICSYLGCDFIILYEN